MCDDSQDRRHNQLAQGPSCLLRRTLVLVGSREREATDPRL